MSRSQDTLSRLESKDFSDQIDQVMQTVDRLNAYYKADHTVADIPHWKSYTKTLAKLSQSIEEQLNILRTLRDSDKKSALLLRINKQRNRIARFSPVYFDALLEALEHSVGQHDPSTEIMDTLKIDPWAIFYFKLNPEKQTHFNALHQQAIKQLASDITEHKRQLLINIPKSEFLELKSERCPNYLALTHYFNQLGGLAQNEILSSPSLAHRTAAMERWILISKACLDQNDFASTFSIKVGLESSAIHRLNATKNSLSTHAKMILKSYDKIFNRQGGTKQPENKAYIPHIGVYRNQLDNIKTNLPQGQSLDDSQKAINIVNKIIAVQNANRMIAKAPKETLLHEKIKNTALGDDQANLLYQKSLTHEPRGASLQPTPIFNSKIRSSLSLLKNRVLVDLLLHEKIVFERTPTRENIEAINTATTKKVSKRKFTNIIKKAGLNLTTKQIQSIHNENRQMFYRNFIENAALRKIAECDGIKKSPIGRSTRRKILKVNIALSRPITENQLSKLLSKLGLSTSSQALHEIIKVQTGQTILKSIHKSTRDVTPVSAVNDPSIDTPTPLDKKLINNQKRARTNTFWNYAKHHPMKTFAGTLIGGVLFAKFLPLTLPILGTYKLGGFLAALTVKFAAGAAVGTATTSVLGTADKSAWFSFFFRSHKRESSSVENTPENNTPRYGNT